MQPPRGTSSAPPPPGTTDTPWRSPWTGATSSLQLDPDVAYIVDTVNKRQVSIVDTLRSAGAMSVDDLARRVRAGALDVASDLTRLSAQDIVKIEGAPGSETITLR